MKKIILSVLGMGIWLYAETVSLTVVDNQTKLEWQNDYTDNGGTFKQSSWIDAITYCKDLSLDEKSDWRLPNVNELESIIDRYSNPVIKRSLSWNLVSTGEHWTSTSYAGDKSMAWHISFVNGEQAFKVKASNNLFVRCVRDK